MNRNKLAELLQQLAVSLETKERGTCAGCGCVQGILVDNKTKDLRKSIANKLKIAAKELSSQQPQIVIKQHGDIGASHAWKADRPELTGSPVIGWGHTWQEALGNLVLNDPDAFGINATVEGVEGVKVLNKDGSPYAFKER